MIQLRPDLGMKESVTVYPLYDVHIGENIDMRTLHKWREEVLSSPDNYVIVGGDILNMALKNSKSDVYGATMSPMQQIDFAVKFLEPIRDRILGIVPGNHESRLSKDTSIDAMRLISSELGIKHLYSPTTCVVWLKVGDRERQIPYSLYFYHGSGGGSSVGGKFSGVKKLSDILDADVYVAGHVHQAGAVPLGYLRRDVRHDSYTEVVQWLINSNDFVMWDGSYGESWGARPTTKVYPRLKFFGNERRVQVIMG